MKKKFKILGIIPARAGSKGIINKNIKIINGKPLIGLTIEEAKKSNLDRLVVVTDSSKISNLAKNLVQRHHSKDQKISLKIILMRSKFTNTL